MTPHGRERGWVQVQRKSPTSHGQKNIRRGRFVGRGESDGIEQEGWHNRHKMIPASRSASIRLSKRKSDPRKGRGRGQLRGRSLTVDVSVHVGSSIGWSSQRWQRGGTAKISPSNKDTRELGGPEQRDLGKERLLRRPTDRCCGEKRRRQLNRAGEKGRPWRSSPCSMFWVG